MGCLALDLGELGHVVRPEAFHHGTQLSLFLCCERTHARDDLVGREVDQPLNFDAHALSVQRGLGEVVDQRGDGSAVAAVEGAERDGRKRVSKRGHDGHPPRVQAPRAYADIQRASVTELTNAR